MKAAEAANWEQSAVEEADAALEDVRALSDELNKLTRIAEEQLTAEGYTFPEEAVPSNDEKARWWREDLTSEAVPITDDIDDALEAGLDMLLQRLPLSWWKRELEMHTSGGYMHLSESLPLYGSVSGQQPAKTIHRYACALALSQDHLQKRDEYDIYEGARLVPFIAALCGLLDALGEVKGGYEKLDELVEAPSTEVDSRLYELAVAARSAFLGRSVEFIEPGGRSSPDLRVHDLGFPAVVECKMQSRLSEHERREFEIMQEVFGSLATERKRAGLVGSLSLTSRLLMENIGVSRLVEASLRCTTRINPYGTIEERWGTISFEPIAPTVELPAPTRIYSPDFLKWVFNWNFETTEYDGICALVENNKVMIVGRAELPFCIKWRSDHERDLDRKARSLASQLSEAWDQVPAGEAGFIYLSYEETHRAALADRRTQRWLDMISGWRMRRRGINPQLVVVNRLYTGARQEGRPNLIESAMPTGFVEEDAWAGIMPRVVFVGRVGR